MSSKSLLHLFTILFLVLSTTAEVALQREEQGGAEASGSVQLEHRSRQLPSSTVLSTEKLSQQARDLGGKGGKKGGYYNYWRNPYYYRWGGKKGGKKGRWNYYYYYWDECWNPMWMGMNMMMGNMNMMNMACRMNMMNNNMGNMNMNMMNMMNNVRSGDVVEDDDDDDNNRNGLSDSTVTVRVNINEQTNGGSDRSFRIIDDDGLRKNRRTRQLR